MSHYEQSVKEEKKKVLFEHLLKNKRTSLREKHVSVCSLTTGKSNSCLLKFTVRKDLEKETVFVLVFSFNQYMSEL